MGVAAYTAIVATVALLIGGVAGGIIVPLFTQRKQQALSESQAMADRRETLTPAYDRILQALNRIESVADKAADGYRIDIPASWSQDQVIVAEAGNGTWPVTDPSEEIQILCMAVSSYSDSLEHALTKTGFTEERFSEIFKRAREQADTAALFRLLDEEMRNRVQVPVKANTLKKASGDLSRFLVGRREYDIKKAS